MFGKPRSSHPTTALAQALVRDGLPPGMDPASLAVFEQSGSYSGRRVTYFRVVDPVRVAERAVNVRAFTDLDLHPELVLGSGHRERDGAIVLSRQNRPAASIASARAQANRSDHADDEHFVFP
jgi:hypothetical protein